MDSYTCPICKGQFLTPSLSLADHLKLLHKAMPVVAKCQFCDQGFEDLSKISEHVSNSHKCGICNARVPNVGAHFSIHDSIPNPTTNTASTSTNKDNATKLHSEHAMNFFTSKTFNQPNEGKNHPQLMRKKLLHNIQNLKVDKDRYKCDICQKVLKSSVAMTYHLKHVHQSKKQTSLCKFCVKYFTTKAGLKNHLKNHLIEIKNAKTDKVKS